MSYLQEADGKPSATRLNERVALWAGVGLIVAQAAVVGVGYFKGMAAAPSLVGAEQLLILFGFGGWSVASRKFAEGKAAANGK